MIDDQADYYDTNSVIEGDRWLTAEERERLRRRNDAIVSVNCVTVFMVGCCSISVSLSVCPCFINFCPFFICLFIIFFRHVLFFPLL